MKTVGICGFLFCLLVNPAFGQTSSSAIRFYGTGDNQLDRIRIPIDDNMNGMDASAPCDIGASNFTLEFWLKGNLADNPSTNNGGDLETRNNNWIYANTIISRDIWGSSNRDFGVSLAGGFIRFGTGAGDLGISGEHTIEGNVNVLDGQWHHVALVRDVITGVKIIYIDGNIDFISSPTASMADISYPDQGVATVNSPWCPYLVLGAEKHDAGLAFPSFNGYMDELRVWNIALSQNQILASLDREIAPDSAGLMAWYRFEEGSGTVISDSCMSQSPNGELIAGVSGNGEWVLWSDDPNNTAPLVESFLLPGFQRNLITESLTNPTVFEFTPDGRVFIAEYDGKIKVVENDALLATPLLQIGGGAKLLGLAIDPDFATNGYIYVYKTLPVNQITRYTVTGNVADPGSAQIIWESPVPSNGQHVGGALAFDNNQFLFITTGDQFQSEQVQDLSNPNGKILRITKDGSIPTDNPFYSTPGVYPAIWAYGVRNPFRLTHDPLSDLLFVGDVGGNASTSWEEINVLGKGKNYGWPNQEGTNCYVNDCSAYAPALFSWTHTDPEYNAGTIQGCVVMGPVYYGNNFPAPYQGNIFYGDYASQFIRRLVVENHGDGELHIHRDIVFANTPVGSIVDIKIGSDGKLYYLTVGLDWSGAVSPAALYRISYIGFGNLPPVAVANAAPTSGVEPLNVSFDSTGSFDPDQGPMNLMWLWTFGDGQTATQANALHSFVFPGLYTAQLSIGDGADQGVSDPLKIQVGNPPQPVILTPTDQAHYQAGDIINFSGMAIDIEDGVLSNSALSWEIILIHNQHTHPYYDIDGVNQDSFTIPISGEHPPEGIFYAIQLTATDSDGLSTTVEHTIHPVMTKLVFDSLPSGIPFFLDGEPESTPRKYQSLAGYSHLVEAQNYFQLNGKHYVFANWSDGGEIKHSINIPWGSPMALIRQYTANYEEHTIASLSSTIDADNRNAQYHVLTGVSYGDIIPTQLICGIDSYSVSQWGFQFVLPIAQNSIIVSAHIEVEAAASQSLIPEADIWAYAVSNISPFDDTSNSLLTQFAPLSAAATHWIFPGFAVDQIYASPDVTALVQEIVNRGDWQQGSYIGFVVDGTNSFPNSWRTIKNFASGRPATLKVSYINIGKVKASFLPH